MDSTRRATAEAVGIGIQISRGSASSDGKGAEVRGR